MRTCKGSILAATKCPFLPFFFTFLTSQQEPDAEQLKMALNVPGLIVMAVFYLVILGTGIWASLRSRKEEKECSGDGMEITLLAGRKISLLVGIFTLTGEDILQAFMPA